MFSNLGESPDAILDRPFNYFDGLDTLKTHLFNTGVIQRQNAICEDKGNLAILHLNYTKNTELTIGRKKALSPTPTLSVIDEEGNEENPTKIKLANALSSDNTYKVIISNKSLWLNEIGEARIDDMASMRGESNKLERDFAQTIKDDVGKAEITTMLIHKKNTSLALFPFFKFRQTKEQLNESMMDAPSPDAKKKKRKLKNAGTISLTKGYSEFMRLGGEDNFAYVDDSYRLMM